MILLNFAGHAHPTLYRVWPAYIKIEKIVFGNIYDVVGYDNDGIAVAEELQLKGQGYFSSILCDIKPTDAHKIATVLHPLTKHLPIVSNDNRHEAYKIIDIYIGKKWPEVVDAPVMPSCSSQARDCNIDFIAEFIDFNPNVNRGNQHNIQNHRYSNELSNYLAEEIILDQNFSLVTYWEGNLEKYPRLSKMFIKFGFIPATSSSVETEFSYTNLVISDSRNRLIPKNVKDIMVARNSVDR